MAKIGLTSGFSRLPEGMYIFQVKEVQYDPTFGKMKILFETKYGQKHMEQFKFLDDKGNPVDGAYNAFSILAKVLLDDFDREEVDDQELVGHFVKCSITHTVSKDGRTYAHLGNDKTTVSGFDDEEPAAEEPAEKPKTDMDSLKALLGLS